MSVKRIDIFHGAIFAERVPDDDDIAPAHVTIARKNDDAIANAINRVTQIGIAAADSVPVFTEMAVRTEAARLVITLRVGLADWEIKAVRNFRKGGLVLQVDRLRQDRFGRM